VKSKESQPSKPFARFLRDVNFPDGSKVKPGQTFVKTWEYINSSSTAWPAGSKLIFVRGDRELLEDVEEFPVPLAKPGEKVEVSCPIRVPAKCGKFKAIFQLADKERNLFNGHRCWIEIDSVEAPETKKREPVTVEEPAKQASKPLPEPVKAEEPAKPQESKPQEHETKVPEPVKAEEPTKPQESKPQEQPAQPKPNPKPQKKAEESSPAPTHKYAKQAGALRTMGFLNTDLNLALLEKCRGNTEQVVSWLIGME